MRFIGPLLCLALALPAQAETSASIQSRRPDLFHPQTGYRIARQRAPTPDDIPGSARLVTTTEAARLLGSGAVAIDVFGALQSRFDELDGTWLIGAPRNSLPGAIWLPEVGRGVLSDRLKEYLEVNLASHVPTPASPVIVFCVADCWMSWNAAQRIAAAGYSNVFWFRLGTDGWLDEGWPLEIVEPVPVNVD